jgi:hypothetical protein
MWADPGARPLIDCVLPHETDRESIFEAFKTLTRASLRRRSAQVGEADVLAQGQAAAALTTAELAEFAAAGAASLMGGWACCVLVDEQGTVSRAERPAWPGRILSSIPKGFLSDTPSFEVRVGDRFLSEVTDEPLEREALRYLSPVSGASIPIVLQSGARYGVLVCCSLRGWADSATFEAVDRLARAVAARAAELAPQRVDIPEFAQERNWERLRDRVFKLDVYRSSGCTIPWRYRALDNGTALFTLGLADDTLLFARLREEAMAAERAVALRAAIATLDRPAFAAAIDFSEQLIDYVAQGFSPPMLLDQRRPGTSIATTGSITSGTATLTCSSGAVVCDAVLWGWLNESRATEGLRSRLDRENPSGLASIVMLGSPPR